MKCLHKLSLIFCAGALLGSPALSPPCRAELRALAVSDPSFLDSILALFTTDLATSKRVLGFLRSRAESARSILESERLPLTEKNRRLMVEVNRSNRVLQESRRQLSGELYTTFKLRIDQARHRAAASDFWIKRKNNPARARLHLHALRNELQETLDTIGWIELLTGGPG